MSEPTQQAGTITLDQASRLLMLSNERIRQLVKEGYIPKPSKNSYPLVGVVQGYIRFLRDEDRRSSKVKADSDLKKARERQIALKTARDEAVLVPIEEARAYVQAIVGTLISSIASLPAQVTRNPDDRRRFETAIDGVRAEVAKAIAQHAGSYRDLPDPDQADEAPSP